MKPAPAATPSGRQVVVVRQGPPPSRRRWADLAAGLIGLMLLVAAVALTVSLPVQTVLPPQYEVSFPEAQVDLLDQTLRFGLQNDTDQRKEFLFNVTHDNVVQIIISLWFYDDLEASDPDVFRIDLYDPGGNFIPSSIRLENPVPQPNATTPGSFDAGLASGTYSFGLTPKPEDAVVEGELNSTEESVEADQSNLHHFGTKGTWRLKVFLAKAGNCPTPSPSSPKPDDAARGAACLQANSAQGSNAAKDAGNELTVGSFSYRYFTVDAKVLD